MILSLRFLSKPRNGYSLTFSICPLRPAHTQRFRGISRTDYPSGCNGIVHQIHVAYPRDTAALSRGLGSTLQTHCAIPAGFPPVTCKSQFVKVNAIMSIASLTDAAHHRKKLLVAKIMQLVNFARVTAAVL